MKSKIVGWIKDSHDNKKKLKGLHRAVKGLILCHSGSNIVPPGENYKRIFIYHATCDKTFKQPEGKLGADWFEYYFLTGDKDLYKLQNFTQKSELLDGKIVKIGMFRSDPIINNSYNREAILKKYKIKPCDKKVILYAPTWKWGGGTLGKCFETFAREIPQKYVLIIRPHAKDKRNIKTVLKWQRKHRVKGLYIFPKQHQDIMDFICVSDLMIGDNSSVNYDFALTKRPVVIVNTYHKDVFTPPDEYNIKLCAPIYDPEDGDLIIEKIDEAFNNPIYRQRMDALTEKSFYFNDGHATDRACSFIVDKLSEMGIVDKERILTKYRDKFTYTDTYA
jgi:CDP-glycerol glycerophosphotransferase (TagB/SpsB family)